VNDTWDDANPGRPKTMGYVGSEEFIRLQFEEYLLSMISSVKCHNYLIQNSNNPRIMLPQVDGDPSADFGTDWIEAWTRTENYRIWQSKTDSQLFDIVEPKHPCAGGLTIDDVQRRIAQQVQDFHLDERFAVGKEVLGRNIAAGREKASTVFNKLYADMEALRESQRRRQEEQKALAERNGGTTPAALGFASEVTKVQTTVQSVGSKAGAYMSSWASWAGERRKNGWGRLSSSTTTTPVKDHGKLHSNMVVREIVNEKRKGTGSEVLKAQEESRNMPRTRARESEEVEPEVNQAPIPNGTHPLNHVISDQVPT
jgi:Transport protein Avl9